MREDEIFLHKVSRTQHSPSLPPTSLSHYLNDNLICWSHCISPTSKCWKVPESQYLDFCYISHSPLVILSSFKDLNAIYMLTIPKYISPDQSIPLNSRQTPSLEWLIHVSHLVLQTEFFKFPPNHSYIPHLQFQEQQLYPSSCSDQNVWNCSLLFSLILNIQYVGTAQYSQCTLISITSIYLPGYHPGLSLGYYNNFPTGLYESTMIP